MIREQDDVTKRLNNNIIGKIKFHMNNTPLYTPIISTELNVNSQSMYSVKRY